MCRRFPMENPRMPAEEKLDADDAMQLAGECFDRIASALDEAIRKAALLGDHSMVERLTRAKAAADRGSKLIGDLADGDIGEQTNDETP